MKTRLLIIFMLMLAFVVPSALKAENTRHPRVAEVEKSLAHEGLELLKGRFPDRPFLIKVKIEPLFRDRPRGDRGNEKLPYLDIVDDEIMDEWDDPGITQEILLDRVKRIYVNASVPANLTDDEINELKETLISNLGMVSGRDSVEISKRSWGGSQSDNSFNRNSITWAIVGFVLFCIGLLAAAWLNTSRIAKAFKLNQKPTPDKPASAPQPAPAQMVMPASEGSRREGSGGGSHSGDIKLTDPLKNREMVAQGLRILETQKGFPSLEDMLILHKFGEAKPGELGALIYEFPQELRSRVFSYSFGEFWLHGLSDPTEVNSSCVEVINKCLRVQRRDADYKLEELKILIWRLQDKNAEFFRGVDQNEAFSLMFDLPKKISLTIARSAYPGSWGMLLDAQFKPQVIADDRIAKLKERAIALLELRSLNALSKFKKESDLLEFLLVADPLTEKEIYVAAGSNSLLPTIRPPFYKIFDLNEDARMKLSSMMRVEDWAVALFNVSRDQRRLIESYLSEKQRYRFLELMKSFDGNPPSRELAGEMRARAGRFAAEIEKTMGNEMGKALKNLKDEAVMDILKAA